MNPWNVIGWIIVVILAIPITMLVLHIIRNLSLRVYNNTTSFLVI